MIHATLIGNLGADAELKDVGDSTVCEFRIACQVYNPKTKERDAQWVRVSMWGARTEKLSEFLTKGKTVVVVGALSVREYEGNNGKGVSVEVKADEVRLVGSPSGNGKQAGTSNDDFPHGHNEKKPAPKAAPKAAARSAQRTASRR